MTDDVEKPTQELTTQQRAAVGQFEASFALAIGSAGRGAMLVMR